ncbi:hypothetical protein MNBD_GAMMA13-2058 [hydrothermal vent metagenome]|uniref:Uncharacterized protein n=1 Tax=hydrothermal vent metagenome TaxID=652676 RepID=A0A3B0YTL0_9ZZZZ
MAERRQAVRDENEITYTSSAGYLLIVFILKTGV